MNYSKFVEVRLKFGNICVTGYQIVGPSRLKSFHTCIDWQDYSLLFDILSAEM